MQRLARGYLIVVSILNGLAGIVCGVLFLLSPDGRLMQAETLLPVVKTLPLANVFFQDFAWIGIAMLLVLGIPNTIAAVVLLRRGQRQYLIALLAAFLLIAWTGFELIFMYNGPAVGYFLVGVLSVLSCTLLLRSGSSVSA